MIPDLIIDVGVNDGRDTAFYLHRGFRVVGIDANPEMIAQCATRFGEAIRAKRLTLLNVGIAPAAGRRTLYLDRREPAVASLNPGHLTGERRIDRTMEIECVPFTAILQDHQVPFYLKVDIETADRACLEALRPPDLPRFVSWEKGPDALECLALMRRLGFDRFKFINQVTFREYSIEESLSNRGRLKFERALGRPVRPFRTKDGWEFRTGCSGPFGAETSGRWLSYDDIVKQWSLFARKYPASASQAGWYDFHATLGG